MAGWLSAAARAFGRTAEEPESLQYSVVCACGRAATGERRGEWQRSQCTSCGEILFVLPKNVYPRAKPAAPAAPKKPPAPPARRPASNEASEPSVKQVVAEAPAEPARSRTKEAKRPAPPVTPPPSPFAIPKRRVITPIRLLMLAIVGVLVVTGSLVVRAQRRERADLTIRSGLPRVEEAMAAGDPRAALHQLEPIVASLDVLGRHDDEAEANRQLFRELTAINELAPVSLFQIVREAGQSLNYTEAEWGRHFGAFHGKWLILDAPVSRTIDGMGANVVALDVPLLVDKKPFRIIADLKAFDTVTLTEEPRPFLFAAQLESCRMPTPEDPAIVLRLKPDTGFLWHAERTWLLAGLGEEGADQAAALKKRLEVQRSLSGGAR